MKLEKETEARLLASIQRFFADELEEDIGDLKALRVLEFCIAEISPAVYNKAIEDAQAYLHEKVSDLSATIYEPEFDYWKKR